MPRVEFLCIHHGVRVGLLASSDVCAQSRRMFFDALGGNGEKHREV
jgi:hypothetical protein